MLALFRRRILGRYPAAPCSPGPFVYCYPGCRRKSLLRKSGVGGSEFDPHIPLKSGGEDAPSEFKGQGV